MVSDELRLASYSSWMGDLQLLLCSSLGDYFSLPRVGELDNGWIESTRKRVSKFAFTEISTRLRELPSLYLLWDRREPLEKGKFSHHVVTLRHYLCRVTVLHFRRVRTRLLFGARQGGYFQGDRANCALGCDHSDSVEHGLFQCRANVNVTRWHVELRQECLSTWNTTWPAFSNDAESLQVLKRVIFHWDSMIPVAQFIYHVSL